MSTALVWLRNDLRTHDHAPLADAARWAAQGADSERAGRVVPVYCVDPRHFGVTPHGFPMSTEERARADLVLGRDYPEPMVDLFESAARQERLWARAAGRSPGQADGRGDRRLEGRRGRDPRGRDGRARRR